MPEYSNKNPSLTKAVEAAQKCDATEMVRHLFHGRALDGLNWKICCEYYGRLSKEDVNDCVASAVASCFTTLAAGRKIPNLVGYILKAARNQAYDAAEYLDMIVPNLKDEASIVDRRSDTEAAAREEILLALRKEALVRARALLPQLGQDNIRNVMEVIFDAVEKEIVDLSDDDISDITGIQPETVRRLKNRGFERLRRLASENGFDIDEYRRAVEPSFETIVDDSTETRSNFNDPDDE